MHHSKSNPGPGRCVHTTASAPPKAIAACSSATSSSSVVILKPEDLLDTADSATVDSRIRWKGAAGIKSTFVLDQPRQYSAEYGIPQQYNLLDAKEDWVACDVPASKYHKEDKVICIYAAAFEAGMRLPFHDLHAAVLQHYGLAPSQLMPNAWRYLNAFVLLCEDAKVQPALPVFLFFFALCAEAEKDADKKGESARKKGQSTGRYHFKPYRYLLPPSEPDSGTGRGRCSRSCSRRRLFTGKMPQSPWKDRFFFIQGPSWPCPIKWGTPSGSSIKEPVLTSDMIDAIKVLAHQAGHTGKDIMGFPFGRNPPVGHLQIPNTATPQLVAVKQEANAAAALTELTRKRKSPEPITPLPALSQPLQSWTGYDDRSTESAPAPAGVGLGRGGETSFTGDDDRSDSWMLHHFAQAVTARLEGKKKEIEALKGELQMAKVQHEADVQALVVAEAQHEAALEAANTKHAADLALLRDEFEKEKQAEASRSAKELQMAVQDAYDKGRRDMQKHLVDLLSDSSLPPVDDQ